MGGEGEGKLLGSLRMLFPPELKKSRRVDGLDDLEPVHASMAGAAERQEPREARDPSAAVMDDQGRRPQARLSTDAAEAAIAH